MSPWPSTSTRWTAAIPSATRRPSAFAVRLLLGHRQAPARPPPAHPPSGVPAHDQAPGLHAPDPVTRSALRAPSRDRAAGVSISMDEIAEGAAGIAAPVFDRRGDLLAGSWSGARASASPPTRSVWAPWWWSARASCRASWASEQSSLLTGPPRDREGLEGGRAARRGRRPRPRRPHLLRRAHAVLPRPPPALRPTRSGPFSCSSWSSGAPPRRFAWAVTSASTSSRPICRPRRARAARLQSGHGHRVPPGTSSGSPPSPPSPPCNTAASPPSCSTRSGAHAASFPRALPSCGRHDHRAGPPAPRRFSAPRGRDEVPPSPEAR